MRVLSFVDAKHGRAADALTERRDATAGRDMKTVSHIKETKVMRTSVDLGITETEARPLQPKLISGAHGSPEAWAADVVQDFCSAWTVASVPI